MVSLDDGCTFAPMITCSGPMQTTYSDAGHILRALPQAGQVAWRKCLRVATSLSPLNEYEIRSDDLPE